MSKMLKALLVIGVLSVGLVSTAKNAQADHNGYWRSHWGWYDNTYRPYYNSYYGPNYNGYYRPSYGGYSPYYGGYNNQPYYGGYYGGGYYGPGVNVRIGNRVNFGWW